MVSDGPRSGPEDGNERAAARLTRPLAVSSRRRALDRLRAAVEAGRSGRHPDHRRAGCRQDLAGGPACWPLASRVAQRLHVDLTRAMTALDFLQLIGHSLGLPLAERLGAARARLHSVLHDDDVDGRRWLLVVDEAHRGSPVVWDEIQALVNQSGRPGGFAALVVLGDTDLARALATRGFGGFAVQRGCFIFTFRRSISTKHASCWDSWRDDHRGRGRPSKSSIAMPGAIPAGCFASPSSRPRIWRSSAIESIASH